MKKLIPLLGVLLLLSGCMVQPFLAPAKLTKDEQALLRMFDPNYPGQVFDFTAPDGAVGLIIRRQHLQDGQWVAASYYLNVTSRTGRIAISFDNLADGLHCAILQKDTVENTASVRHGAAENPTDIFTVSETLSTPVNATLNTEIPMLMQLHKAGYEVPLPGASMNAYPNTAAFSDYDQVYLVTATFTDKPLE